MQLRRSPGGSMLKSLRRRPEEPPSSVTVTTAARSEIRPGTVERPPGVVTWRQRPRRRVERPVPPPIATTRRGRKRSVVSDDAENNNGRSLINELGALVFDVGGVRKVPHHGISG